jgi:hypothetical protein
MRALSFINFCLFEGASIEGNDGKVTLNYNNNRDNQKEVLKTTDKRQHIKYYPNDNTPNSNKFRVRWGLDYDLYRGVIDHDGRFKYTMDQLKDANIVNKDKSLNSFLKASYDDLGISQLKPDYIVAVGSTAGLVANLVSISADLFPKAETFNLPKIEYANIGHAIDWDELQRQKGGAHTHRFLGELFGKHANNSGKLKRDMSEIDNFGELKEFIEEELPNVDWKTEGSDGKSLIPFKVRSSGVWSRDGFRDFLKPKYDTISNDFNNLILECISDNKKMLIIDDNRNSDTDIRSIFSEIDRIAHDLGADDNSKYRQNFMFYLLYSMAEKDIDPNFSWKTSSSGKEHTTIRKDSAASTDFASFILTGERGEKYKTSDSIQQKKELNIVNIIHSVKQLYNHYLSTKRYDSIESMDKALNHIANNNNSNLDDVKRSYGKALKSSKMHNDVFMWPYKEKIK